MSSKAFFIADMLSPISNVVPGSTGNARSDQASNFDRDRLHEVWHHMKEHCWPGAR